MSCVNNRRQIVGDHIKGTNLSRWLPHHGSRGWCSRYCTKDLVFLFLVWPKVPMIVSPTTAEKKIEKEAFFFLIIRCFCLFGEWRYRIKILSNFSYNFVVVLLVWLFVQLVFWTFQHINKVPNNSIIFEVFFNFSTSSNYFWKNNMILILYYFDNYYFVKIQYFNKLFNCTPK